MRKVLMSSVGTIAFTIMTTIAFSEVATAGSKAKVAPAVVTTTVQCHYPKDLSCPHTKAHEDFYFGGHDLAPEQQALSMLIG